MTRPITLSTESESAIPQRVYLTGMYLALAGILMFFTGLVSAWVVRKGLSTSSLEAPLEFPRGLILFNTLALVASSVTLEVGRRGLRDGKTEKFRRWSYVSSALAIGFLAGQLVAWRLMAAAGVDLASNPDAGFFYLFAAAYGIFLLGGIAGLLTAAFKKFERISLETAARAAGTYWHFLTALWCVLCALFVRGATW